MSDQINVEDLNKQIIDLKNELYSIRIQSDKSNNASSIRRKIARLYTKINSTNN